ncbi:Uncharacterised protein [Mycobacteroides abscessus subsp. massiliense]|nr:Uncharacterised protein [Mycobacteroides abscessus subsp. massiliense]
MDQAENAVGETSGCAVRLPNGRRHSGLCATCLCTSIGSRACRRGENGDPRSLRPSALTDSGVRAVPLILAPPNRVREALAHYGASIASS